MESDATWLGPVEAEPEIEASGWTLAGMNIPRLMPNLNGTITLLADGESDGLDQLESNTSATFIISPGVSSDFETSENAFRLIGHAMAVYQWRPDIQWTFGVG